MNQWRWTDKYPVVYTNWGTNQPGTSPNDKGCAYIDGFGGWYLADSCDGALAGVICEILCDIFSQKICY